jgi:hypothetical protein
LGGTVNSNEFALWVPFLFWEGVGEEGRGGEKHVHTTEVSSLEDALFTCPGILLRQMLSLNNTWGTDPSNFGTRTKAGVERGNM